MTILNQATPFRLEMVKENSINWLMFHKYANRGELDHKPIADYYDKPENVEELGYIFKFITNDSGYGHELLNFICRVSYYITEHRHQEWLTRMLMVCNFESIKSIYIDQCGLRDVRNTRKLIWNLLV